MAQERVQKNKATGTQGTREAVAPMPTKADAEELARRAQATEDLLAEIDEVLEENAEEFVRGYVQKGGE